MNSPCAAVVTVGDELVEGRITDTHAAYASERLTRLGVPVGCHLSVGDAPGVLASALRSLVPEYDPVLIIGGLGPTEDDRTRSEVASAAGVELEFREASWEQLRERYGARLRNVERNRRQAFFPVGSEEIENEHGTAPAFVLRGERSDEAPGPLGWWVLPGVPREFRGLLDEVVLPALAAGRPELPPATIRRFFGISESVLDGWLLEQVPNDLRAHYHVCVADGEIEVRLPTGVAIDRAAEAEYGVKFLGVGEATLAERVVARAVETGRRVTVAESCTGGLVASRLVEVAGASACFDQSWVTYSYASKARELGVDPAVLEQHGAVDERVVLAMAEGAAKRAKAEIAVAISGIAGPDGGTPDKPVGTVWIGWVGPNGPGAKRHQFPGDRDRIRALATNHALFSLWRQLQDPSRIESSREA